MLLGIDFGTTRTVVAAVDRGNYPVISFHGEGGDTSQWYPSIIAARAGELAFGLDAASRQNDPEWMILRSFKRGLAALGPESKIELGGRVLTSLELLTSFLAQLRRDLYERSNLRAGPEEGIEAMISVPANSNSNQRFITMEAFRRAGFSVRGMINEPSAAGIEYAHHYSNRNPSSRREYMIVYDLGGGTFDSSVISIAEQRHEVVSSEGISELGGDDFDNLLLELALGEAGAGEIPGQARVRLLEECREKKEGLHSNTRRIAIDLGRVIDGAGEIVVSATEFYDRCRPLVERTIEAMEASVAHLPAAGETDWRSVAAIYLVGGSSDLPIIARMLRERYGRQVRKSPYPHAATAIGLAIAGDQEAGYHLRERFTRHFGVWREAEEGHSITIDVLFEKGTLLPEGGGDRLTRSRRYRPAHNIGHFRYIECGRVDERGQPTGDIAPWDEIYFAFDPSLEGESRLQSVPVARADHGEQLIEEVYSVDEHGIIEVEIINHTGQYRRGYKLRAAGSLP
ncbi:MAG TPA: Hsp70 family protein [Blastocatellia bacterium]